jgi:hypothetical protein
MGTVKSEWGNHAVDPRKPTARLRDEAVGPKYFDTTSQPLVVGQDTVFQANGNCAQENIDCAARDAVILAEIEQLCSFDIISPDDLCVLKRFEQSPYLVESHLVPDAGEYLLSDGAEYDCATVLNGFTELLNHVQLARA